MHRGGRRAGLAAIGTLVLLAGVPAEGMAHRLPVPPRLELLASVSDPANPGLRTYVVRVVETATGKPLALDEPVLVSARLAEWGLEAEPIELRPTGAPGVFAGQLSLPATGRWHVTVEMVGRAVEREGPPPGAPEGGGRDPAFWDGIVFAYLVRQWGHLLGFALWLGAGLWLRFGRSPDARTPLIVLWGGLILAHGTALDKMWYSTPPFHETPYIWNYDRLRSFPFAGQYTGILFAKQLLAATAVVLAVPLTRRLRRATRGEGKSLGGAAGGWVGAQIMLALAIGGLAVTLDMLHKVVDHFLR